MPAPIRFGSYLLLERLAVGGMAEIFLAKMIGDSGFERLCVVKRALPHLSRDPEFTRMFVDEARLAALLHHPGIVQIHELGRSGDDFYIAMEYLAGEDLAAVLVQSREQGLPVPLEVATRVIAAAADALHCAHTFSHPTTGPMRMVHRDVSPSNLFATFHGGVKVLDFGVARAEGRLATTLAGVTKGKLSYMSPEQAQGLEVDARTDVWALGLCLRELLTGRRLFGGKTAPLERLRHIVHAPILPPGTERDDVPPELDRITMRALQRDPDQRYPTAAALAADLEALLSDPQPAFGTQSLAGYLQQLYGDDHIRAKTSPHRVLEQPSPRFVPLQTLRLDAPRPVTDTAPAPTTQPIPAAGVRIEPAPIHEGAALPKDASEPPPMSEEAPPRSLNPIDPVPQRRGEGLQRASELPAPPASVSGWQRALQLGGLLALIALIVAVVPKTWWQTAAERSAPEAMAPASSIPKEARVSLQDAEPDRGPSRTEAELAPTGQEAIGDRAAQPDAFAPEGASAAAQDGVAEADAAPGPDSSTAPLAQRARPVRPPAAGTLTLRANVPVEAFLGARSLGPVPIEAVRVPAGRHTLRLVNAERGLTHEAPLRIASGKPTVREVVLATGTLNVDAVPWAEVWIDGKKLGLTPIAGHVLWEGPHQLRLVGPDGSRQRTVRIRPGRVTAIREDLRAPSAAR